METHSCMQTLFCLNVCCAAASEVSVGPALTHSPRSSRSESHAAISLSLLTLKGREYRDTTWVAFSLAWTFGRDHITSRCFLIFHLFNDFAHQRVGGCLHLAPSGDWEEKPWKHSRPQSLHCDCQMKLPICKVTLLFPSCSVTESSPSEAMQLLTPIKASKRKVHLGTVGDSAVQVAVGGGVDTSSDLWAGDCRFQVYTALKFLEEFAAMKTVGMVRLPQKTCAWRIFEHGWFPQIFQVVITSILSGILQVLFRCSITYWVNKVIETYID